MDNNWIIEHYASDHEAEGQWFSIVDSNDERIAKITFRHNCTFNEEKLAKKNAQLISVLPCIMGALKALHKQCCYILGEDKEMDEAIMKAGEAIEKAESKDINIV